MVETMILILSVGFQLAAVAYAISFIRLTQRRSPWILISSAFTLMGIRRLITLLRTIHPAIDYGPDIYAEIVSLMISVIILLGVIAIKSLFVSANQNLKNLNKSNEQKSLLLQEIHHRVKNNLQIISSILDMNMLRVKDPAALNLFADVCAKIHGMVLLHNRLYKGEEGNLEKIDMRSLLIDIIRYMKKIHDDRLDVKYKINVSDLYLPLGFAMPCMLIISEMISNSYKHGFAHRNGKKPWIWIDLKLSSDQAVFLDFRDNGSSISNESEIEKPDSLGVKLIKNLVKHQLKGTINCDTSKGMNWFISFPLSAEEHLPQMAMI